MSNTDHNDVKKLASNIEVLAREFQLKLDTNGDFLSTANELTRNSLTFVFTLGSLYGNQKAAGTKTVKAKAVGSAHTNHSYHNVRDSYGRFARKV